MKITLLSCEDLRCIITKASHSITNACPESEEEDDAPPPQGFTTPTKVIRNDGACHAELDAEGTESESDADVEKQFCESTAKKHNYTGYQKYRFIKRWVTGEDAVLEEAENQHEIYTEMKKLMHASGLKKTPGHKQKETDIHLWKQYSKAYRNDRRLDAAFSISAQQPIWMSSAGETNHRRQFHPARIQRYA